ncbi:VWA domain-containing protein [candidate division GN15 bacterium]|nr:VWA domain-containing protein [candidate division GN15 bacterium]
MRFAEPTNFILLVGVLVLAAFMFWAVARKKSLLQKFGDIPLVMKNAPYISFARQRTKAVLLIVALVFVTMALARLQFGTHLELVKREGIDLIVAVDVSTSMLARDMRPNRLERAKQQVRTIIDRLDGDRVGLIAFAGEAFVQCPLTLDYSAAQMLLGAMDDNSVSVQGTSIAEAIETAMKSFDQKERKYKVLLLLTDGETHDKRAEETAEKAREEGIRIYTVGIGSPAGEPIPILDRSGNQVGFKKDEDGEVIVSRLDEETLQKVALATGGKFYMATPGEMELDRIFEEINRLEKKELEGSLVTKYDDRFQWPLLFALILIVAEFFVPERKKPVGGMTHA